MYIKLINCFHVHIYNKNAFVYTDNNVFVMDDTSTKLLSIIQMNSSYSKAISILSAQTGLEKTRAVELANEIISVNHRFFMISKEPNTVLITGHLNTRFPSMLQIALTNKCVHKCRHCFKNCDSIHGTDIPINTLYNLLDQVKGECKYIEFTGGEPLLYPYILDVIQHYNDTFQFRITTSGYTIQEFKLSDIQRFEVVQISLHGSTDVIHDAFVGKKGSFNTVTKNIRWLCENNIKVVITRAVNSYDKVELDKFIRLCINLGVKHIIIGIIVPAGRALLSNCATQDKEIEKITEYIKQAQEKFPKINLAIDEEHFISKQNSSYLFHCIGGRLNLYIDEIGNVFSCPYCQEAIFSIGNITEESNFCHDLIYNARYEHFNENIVKKLCFKESEFTLNELHLKDICPNIRIPERFSNKQWR